jgi:chemotaxis protein CheX
MDADVVPDEDIADVLGELANIVGGNVKSMLPNGCALSTPYYVGRGEALVGTDPGTECVAELVGEWRNETLSVAMWQDRAESLEMAA